MADPIDELLKQREITAHAAGLYAAGQTTAQVMADLQARFPEFPLSGLVTLASTGQAIAGEYAAPEHAVPVQVPSEGSLDVVEGSRPQWVEREVTITKSDGTTETKDVRITVGPNDSWQDVEDALDGIIDDISEGYGDENVSTGATVLIY